MSYINLLQVLNNEEDIKKITDSVPALNVSMTL